MADIAAEAEVLPTRISFIAALNILVSQVRVCGKGGGGEHPLPPERHERECKSVCLARKRKHRRYDRLVLFVPPKYPFSYKSRELK